MTTKICKRSGKAVSTEFNCKNCACPTAEVLQEGGEVVDVSIPPILLLIPVGAMLLIILLATAIL